MSKELTPLEALGIIAYGKEMESCDVYVCRTTQKKAFQIVETALKDYENLKLKHRSMQDAVLDDFKKLKALEIIKSFVYFDIIEVQGQWYLIQGTSFDKSLKLPITKEQAKLLKEVLL